MTTLLKNGLSINLTDVLQQVFVFRTLGQIFSFDMGSLFCPVLLGFLICERRISYPHHKAAWRIKLFNTYGELIMLHIASLAPMIMYSQMLVYCSRQKNQDFLLHSVILLTPPELCPFHGPCEFEASSGGGGIQKDFPTILTVYKCQNRKVALLICFNCKVRVIITVPDSDLVGLNKSTSVKESFLAYW